MIAQQLLASQFINGLPNGIYECVVRMNGSVDDRSSTVQTVPLIVRH